MKLAADISEADIREHLERNARRDYGEERAAELAEQLDHLARMLHRVAAQPVDLQRDRPESLSHGEVRE